MAIGAVTAVAQAPSAAALGLVQNYPYEVVVGTPITFTYALDPGEVIQLTWEVSDNPTVVTTCSAASPAGCQYTVTWTNAGFRGVCLNRTPENICAAGAAQVRVLARPISPRR